MEPGQDTYAVIPAYNAGPEIVRVVVETSRHLGRDRVLVVNDGSEDGEPEKLRADGYWVIDHPQNRGKGAALQTGFRAVLERGGQAVVTLDADGQHGPEWIPELLTASREGCVVGPASPISKQASTSSSLTPRFPMIEPNPRRENGPGL